LKDLTPSLRIITCWFASLTNAGYIKNYMSIIVFLRALMKQSPLFSTTDFCFITSLLLLPGPGRSLRGAIATKQSQFSVIPVKTGIYRHNADWEKNPEIQ
jgi:hypothetical protein